MSNRYALVENGVVVNVIVWDGAQFNAETGEGWAPPEGQQAVVIPDDSPAAIGWSCDGSTFTPPA